MLANAWAGAGRTFDTVLPERNVLASTARHARVHVQYGPRPASEAYMTNTNMLLQFGRIRVI